MFCCISCAKQPEATLHRCWGVFDATGPDKDEMDTALRGLHRRKLGGFTQWLGTMVSLADE